MVKKVKIVSILFLLFFSCLSFGQDKQQENENKENENKEKAVRKNAIAFSFGSPGYGFEYARKLNKKLSARVIWNTFSYKNFELKNKVLGGEKVDINANLNITVYDVLLEYNPFRKSSLKLVFGVGFVSKTNLEATINYAKDKKVGDVVINKDNIGQLTTTANWSGASPYLGLGFGRAISKKRIGFGIEFGSYFTSSPKVDVKATKLLEPTAKREGTIQEALKSYKYIPKINLRLSYNF